MATDSTFPNFTVPSYEFHGTWSNNISKVTQVTFAPLVTKDDRLLWESYATEHQDWLQESLDAQYNDLHTDHVDDGNHSQLVISSFIYQSLEGAQEQGMATREEIIHEDVGPWAYAPVWQQVPAPHDPSIVNYDLLANTVFARTFRAMLTAQKPVLSEPSQLEFLYGGAIHDAIVHPHSFLLTPVFESVEVHEENDIVGLLASVVSWDIYFKDILHEGANGIIVVLDDPIGDQFTYMINGPEAIFLGDGDLHDPKYNNLEVRTPFAPFLAHEQGEYYLRVYPSVKLENHYKTNKPFWFAATVLVIFAFTAMVFLLFDYSVAARQQKMMIKAKRTHAIISSLFPANVRDRMLKEAEEKELMGAGASKQSQLRDFLGKKRDDDDGAVFDTKPIADLFPSATVLVRTHVLSILELSKPRNVSFSLVYLKHQFADIVGFTAWSSTREPTQVFTLLESVYHAFDKIAQRRRVFKVSITAFGPEI